MPRAGGGCSDTSSCAHSEYGELGVPLQAVLTDNGRAFCGRDDPPCELYLDLDAIGHRTTRVGRPRSNGFGERLNGTGLDESFRITSRQNFYESVRRATA